MKKLILAPVGLAICLLSSCSTPMVRVIDSKSLAPVPNAAVVGKNGEWSTPTAYTDYNGIAPEPALPQGVRDIVVSKSGYNTKTLRLY